MLATLRANPMLIESSPRHLARHLATLRWLLHLADPGQAAALALAYPPLLACRPASLAAKARGLAALLRNVWVPIETSAGAGSAAGGADDGGGAETGTGGGAGKAAAGAAAPRQVAGSGDAPATSTGPLEHAGLAIDANGANVSLAGTQDVSLAGTQDAGAGGGALGTRGGRRKGRPRAVQAPMASASLSCKLVPPHVAQLLRSCPRLLGTSAAVLRSKCMRILAAARADGRWRAQLRALPPSSLARCLSSSHKVRARGVGGGGVLCQKRRTHMSRRFAIAAVGACFSCGPSPRPIPTRVPTCL